MKYDVAVNDLEGIIEIYERDGQGKKVLVWRCPFYKKWADMLHRALSKREKMRYKSYEGASVCDDWLKLSNFRAWMETQEWEGKQLDKDLLVPGNKLYSPETCVFIGPKLNKFLISGESHRGECLVGVHQKDGKYASQCCNPFTGKQEHLGTFSNEIDAHMAWRAKKHEHAIAFAEEEEDVRVKLALLSRYAG